MKNTVNILEERVKDKVKAVKIKDEAYREFKRVKTESERQMNDAVLELESVKKRAYELFQCTLCGFEV